MLQYLVSAVFTDVTTGLESLGFRVGRQRRIEESLLFLDTQDGVIYARGGRLARCRQRGGPRWRFSQGGAGWIDGSSLAELRGQVPWLPAAADLHPVVHASRSESALRLRSVATRELTLVVESWSFSGPYSAADNGQPDEGPPLTVVSAAGINGAATRPSSAVPVRAMPPRWYLEPDAGPPHDLAYVNLVLEEHAAVLGCERGRPAPRWDPLASGLELLDRLPPGLPVPLSLRLQRGDRLATLLCKVVRLQGLRLASCLDGVLHDRHPEYVHDARVATRRARFALRIAALDDRQAARELRDRLGRVARLIGPVRDLDVLLPRLGVLADAAHGESHDRGESAPRERDLAQRRLADALYTRRAQRLQQAQEALPGADLACLPGLLSRWNGAGVGGAPVTAVAAATIHAALAQVVRTGQAVTGPAASKVSDLHRLRLRLKRLRYTSELFAGALPRRRGNRALTAVVGRCAAAQTSLGELNDDAVAAAEIRAVVPLLERPGGGSAAAAVTLARALLELLERRQRTAARDIRRRWPRLRKRLEEAVAEL